MLPLGTSTVHLIWNMVICACHALMSDPELASYQKPLVPTACERTEFQSSFQRMETIYRYRTNALNVLEIAAYLRQYPISAYVNHLQNWGSWMCCQYQWSRTFSTRFHLHRELEEVHIEGTDCSRKSPAYAQQMNIAEKFNKIDLFSCDVMFL